MVLAVEDYESIMETLALLNDPIDRDRLVEAGRSVAAEDVTDGEDVASLLAARTARATGAA